jgi:hypothetical protein
MHAHHNVTPDLGFRSPDEESPETLAICRWAANSFENSRGLLMANQVSDRHRLLIHRNQVRDTNPIAMGVTAVNNNMAFENGVARTHDIDGLFNRYRRPHLDVPYFP